MNQLKILFKQDNEEDNKINSSDLITNNAYLEKKQWTVNFEDFTVDEIKNQFIQFSKSFPYFNIALMPKSAIRHDIQDVDFCKAIENYHVTTDGFLPIIDIYNNKSNGYFNKLKEKFELLNDIVQSNGYLDKSRLEIPMVKDLQETLLTETVEMFYNYHKNEDTNTFLLFQTILNLGFLNKSYVDSQKLLREFCKDEITLMTIFGITEDDVYEPATMQWDKKKFGIRYTTLEASNKIKSWCRKNKVSFNTYMKWIYINKNQFQSVTGYSIGY